MANPAPAPKSFVVHTPVMVPLADLNPAAYNPRTISPEKYEGLKQSILTDGFVESVAVQKKGLRIIGGHQRVRAAKELSIEAGIAPPAVPCVVLDIDDRQAKKLNLKLNRLRGEFDARLVGELLLDIFEEPKTITPEDTHLLGFEPDEAAKFMRIVEPSIVLGSEAPTLPENETRSFGKSITLSIEFTTIATRDRVKKLLIERSQFEKKKSGDLVADAIAPMPKSGAKKTAAKKKKRAAA